MYWYQLSVKLISELGARAPLPGDEIPSCDSTLEILDLGSAVSYIAVELKAEY